MEGRGKGTADLCRLQKWCNAVAAEGQLEETALEEKFVVCWAKIFLQRDALYVFLVLFLSEGDASGLAVKRRLAGRQGRSTKCGTALKRGTDTQQASGFGARSF